MHLIYKALVWPLDSYCFHSVIRLVGIKGKASSYCKAQLLVGSSCKVKDRQRNIPGHIQDTPDIYKMAVSNESYLRVQLEETMVSWEKEMPASKGS